VRRCDYLILVIVISSFNDYFLCFGESRAAADCLSLSLSRSLCQTALCRGTRELYACGNKDPPRVCHFGGRSWEAVTRDRLMMRPVHHSSNRCGSFLSKFKKCSYQTRRFYDRYFDEPPSSYSNFAFQIEDFKI
jgi:hypothetical protein